MTEIKKRELRAYVRVEDHKRLEKEANNRGLSLSKTVRVCLLEYLELREELATAVANPGEPGDEHSGKIIHSLLARTEERLATTIERLEERVSQQQEQLQVQMAMLDRLYLGIMQHLPEIPEKLADGAVASATRRHTKWIKAIEKLLAEEGSCVLRY